jgi:hypothetical protein
MKEMIIASAIKLVDEWDGRVFVGKRRNEAQRNAMSIIGQSIDLKDIAEYGFITTELRFITREEAYVLAKENGQFKRKKIQINCGIEISTGYDGPMLYSEDLW